MDGKLSPTPGPTWPIYQLEVSQVDLIVEGSYFAQMQCSQQLTVWLEKSKALSFLYVGFLQVLIWGERVLCSLFRHSRALCELSHPL